MKISLSNIFSLLLFWLTFYPEIASADIYRCDKQAGVITLSNVEKGKNCKKMVLPPPEKKSAKPSKPDASAPVTPSAMAESKQVKNKSTFESAASERKRIIQEEIDLEQDRLNKATEKVSALTALKKKSAAQEKELNSLQQKQGLYQSNIALLQKELNK